MNRYDRIERVAEASRKRRATRAAYLERRGTPPPPGGGVGVPRPQSGSLSDGELELAGLPSRRRLVLSEFAMRSRAAVGKTLREMWSGRPHLHPRWKGGRWVNNNGYVSVYMGNGRPRKLEHRLVMEGVLGRPLTRQETVHHKNGIRTDNRPENLELWRSNHGPGQRVADMVPEDPRFCPIQLTR